MTDEDYANGEAGIEEMTGEQADKLLSPDNSFWARVEMMGRRIYHGKVTTEALGGAALLRVDTPPIPEITVREKGYYRAENDPEGGYQSYGIFDITYPATAGESHLIGIASIYEITPMAEETATKLAMDARSLQPTQVIRIQSTPLIEPAYDEVRDSEDLDDGC